MFFIKSRLRKAHGREAAEFALPTQRANVMPRMLEMFLHPVMCLYMIVVVTLPSGRLYSFNFKAPLYVVLLPASLYALFTLRRPIRRDISLLVGIPAIFTIWVALSQIYRFSLQGAIRQYSDIILMLFTCWLISIFCERKRNGPTALLRLVIFAEALACVVKVGILAYAALSGIPVSAAVLSLNSVFGADLMNMDFGVILGRIQFISDGLIPICVYAVLRYREKLQLGGFACMVIMILLVISVVFSFSRYFWGFTSIAALLGIALGRKDKIFVLLISTVGIAVAASAPLLIELVNTRFSQDLVSYSDEFRVAQVTALDEFFFEAPLFGHGLGSYNTQFTRGEDESKYSYEVQLMALAGQVGIVGVTILSGLSVFYFRHLWPPSSHSVAGRLSLMLLLAIWIAAGLFNPLLLNPVAAVSYGGIMAMGKLETDHSDQPNIWGSFFRRQLLGLRAASTP